MKSYFLFSITLLFLLACNSSKNMNTKDDSTSVQWTEIAQGSYCGVHEEQRVHITDEESWAKLWKEVGSNRIPPPDLPQVNFGEYSIVALFMGDRSNGGFEQGIEGMSMQGDQLIVKLTHVTPGNNCITTEAIVQPYNIVSIAKQYAKEVSFEVGDVTRDCN